MPILILLILLQGALYGQNIRNFRGAFELNDTIKGTASYTYKLIYDSVVYHGRFNFTSDLHRNRACNRMSRLNINGLYNNGLKEGKWTYEAAEYQLNIIGIQDLRPITSLDGVERKTICEFKKGVADGVWEIFRNKVVDGKRGVRAISSKTQFKQGIIHGVFIYEDQTDDKINSVRGHFNDEGFFDGIWVMNYSFNSYNYEETRNYENGFLLELKLVNKTTGQTEYNIVYQEIINKLSRLKNNDPAINYKLGEKSFGLLFDNAYEINSDQIKAQLIGNQVLDEIFSKFDSRAAIIGMLDGAEFPEIYFTRRFRFTNSENEVQKIKLLKESVQSTLTDYDNFLSNNKFILHKQKTDSLSIAYVKLEHASKRLQLIDSITSKLVDGSFDYVNRDRFFINGIPELKATDTLKYIIDGKSKIHVMNIGVSIQKPDSLIDQLISYTNAIRKRLNPFIEYCNQKIQFLNEEKELELIEGKIISLVREVDSLYNSMIDFETVKQRDLNFKFNGRSEAQNIIPEMYFLFGVNRKSALIEKYGKETEFEKKQEIGNGLIQILTALINIYPDLKTISRIRITLDSAFTRYSANPFMDRSMESRIKPHIFSRGTERLLPFLLEDLKRANNGEEIIKKNAEILAFRKRMLDIALRDDDEIDKLNARMRRETVPERIKRLLGLSNAI
jgi:hypothetical protein